MININTIFKSIKSIVCLNGETPSKEHFLRYKHLPLIAADGAGHRLINMGITPNIIVGDFDSIDKSFVTTEIELIHVPEQNRTDFDKCLEIVYAKNIFPCLVYGATGRESDHTLYNFLVLEKFSSKFLIILHDSACTNKDKYGVFVHDALHGMLQRNGLISFFAFNNACISTKGLVWELEKLQLTAQISNTRNAIKEREFKITVHSGNVLVFVDVPQQEILFNARDFNHNIDRAQLAENLC